MILAAFGANLPSREGNPPQTYQKALSALKECGVNVVQASRLWQSSPVGTPDDQPWYTNAVMEVETTMPPEALLDTFLQIEADFGRVRTYRNAPKGIDLDLIDYHGKVQTTSDPILPHPRMHARGFVLLPLREIAPGWVHPVSGSDLATLIAALPDDQELFPLQD